MGNSAASIINDSNNDPELQFATWLAEQLAPTLLGSKPATLLTLSDLPHLPLLSWWDSMGQSIFKHSCISVCVMFSCHYRKTILFYQPSLVERCLRQTQIASFLRRRGYCIEKGIAYLLTELAACFSQSFPHEIGLLLGIPLKDVQGFMGLSACPLACRKYWCVYGNPRPSLQRMSRHLRDQHHIRSLLHQGVNPLALLTKKNSA
jgi:hypothetical protein